MFPFASYVSRGQSKPRLIFSRINGPNEQRKRDRQAQFYSSKWQWSKIFILVEYESRFILLATIRLFALQFLIREKNLELAILLLITSNSWHYNCPRSICSSLKYYRFIMTIFTQIPYNSKTRWQMFLLVSVRHVGAHPDELQHGVSIQSSINLGKTFPRISRIRIIPSTQILARVFVYLPPFISQILDFICRMVLIFILIYFGWRDTENQQ